MLRETTIWYVWPNSPYCVDRKGAGYDFELRPRAEHDSEIIILGQTAQTEPCLSSSKAGRWESTLKKNVGIAFWIGASYYLNRNLIF
jgi:hypothetical protein